LRIRRIELIVPNTSAAFLEHFAWSVVAGLVAFLAGQVPAKAQNAYCDNLRTQIASAGVNSGAERYRAAAAKQQSEINRTAAYARSLGCDRQQFLFFGDPPPPQCASLNARISQMQANLAALQQRAGGDPREALIARYDAQCRDPRAVSTRVQRPRNFFEELFGITPQDGGVPPQEVPLDPLDQPQQDGADTPHGGPVALCVRSCDGGFFPISYSARRSNLDELNSLCKALCPNTEATLYTRSARGQIENSVSIDGAAYTELPNALKFQKTYDPACTCKPQGKTWVEALAEAERILAASHGEDEQVTAEQAEQMSRPLSPSETGANSKVKKRGQKQPAPVAQELPMDAAVAPPGGAREESAKNGSSEAPNVFREVVGPDGVKRRVRVVAPSL
jgi:hypothetical protein